MKTLTAVIVFILLAITAGGVSGYFLYTDLVKDTSAVVVQQQEQIDQLVSSDKELQKEVIEQRVQLNKDTRNLNTVIEVLNQVLKLLEETPTSDKPSKFNNSTYTGN